MKERGRKEEVGGRKRVFIVRPARVSSEYSWELHILIIHCYLGILLASTSIHYVFSSLGPQHNYKISLLSNLEPLYVQDPINLLI